MKTLSHSAPIPPLTDHKEFLGAYKALLNALQIQENIPFPLSAGFTHPVEKENQALTTRFFHDKSLFQQLKLNHPLLRLLEVRVHNHMATFIFGYPEIGQDEKAFPPS